MTEGFVNDGANGSFVGEVFERNVTTNPRITLGITKLEAVYEVIDGDRSFTALMQGGTNNQTGAALLEGVILADGGPVISCTSNFRRCPAAWPHRRASKASRGPFAWSARRRRPPLAPRKSSPRPRNERGRDRQRSRRRRWSIVLVICRRGLPSLARDEGAGISRCEPFRQTGKTALPHDPAPDWSRRSSSFDHPIYQRSASGFAGRRCDLRSDRREAPRSAPFLSIQRSDSTRLAARDVVPPTEHVAARIELSTRSRPRSCADF